MNVNPNAVLVIAFLITATLVVALVWGSWVWVPLALFGLYTVYAIN